ncbi:hypothetical protein K440DRAFT_642038 [Wilcoxina mikolae CBS 423.85]|nr:hypothetical protein K440DRAFT_642038 [Wilcoxina mikolae CBS 423.85]
MTPDDVTEVVDDVTKVVDDVTEVVDDVTEVVNDVTEVVDDVTEVVNDVTEVVDDVTEVVDDVTEVVDKDDEATSSDNESSEIAVTPISIRTKVSCKRKRAGRPSTPNSTKDKPIDRYDAVITCSDYMERDVRYTYITARDQIVLGMIAMRNLIITAEETLGEALYFINERKKREDERRKRTQRE